MHLNDIGLKDRDLFRNFLSSRQYGISEFTFTNLYIWKHDCDIKYTVINDFLCVCGVENSLTPFWLMPVGKGDLGSAVNELIAFNGVSGKIFFKSLSPEMKSELETACPGMFEFEAAPNLYDYVYLQSDLSQLTGKKYHSKRNHIHKFESLYQYNYRPFTSDMASLCLRASEEWFEKRGDSGDSSLLSEKTAISEIINDFDALDIKGAVIMTDNKVVAFSFGEMLTEDTAVIHIEKADTDYEGSYSVINREFCSNAFSAAAYINREEDMGLEGLRKAKQSYHPLKLIEKFNAYLK